MKGNGGKEEKWMEKKMKEGRKIRKIKGREIE